MKPPIRSSRSISLTRLWWIWREALGFSKLWVSCHRSPKLFSPCAASIDLPRTDPDRRWWRVFNRQHFSSTKWWSHRFSSDLSIFWREGPSTKRLSPDPHTLYKTQARSPRMGYTQRTYQIVAQDLQNNAFGSNHYTNFVISCSLMMSSF